LLSIHLLSPVGAALQSGQVLMRLQVWRTSSELLYVSLGLVN